MKYCLPDLSLEESDALVKRYVDYFDSIKYALPPDLLLFADRRHTKLSLNDGWIRTVNADMAEGTVEIVIEGDATDANWRTIGGRLFFFVTVA